MPTTNQGMQTTHHRAPRGPPAPPLTVKCRPPSTEPCGPLALPLMVPPSSLSCSSLGECQSKAGVKKP